MTRYIAAYAATFVVMVGLDLLWLGLIARPLYQQGIGHLMADKPNLPVALLFYVVYALGLVIFAVSADTAQGWSKALAMGAMFGFFAYATYDLTNLATLRQWPWSLSMADIVWGTLVSGVSAAAGKLALDRFGSG